MTNKSIEEIIEDWSKIQLGSGNYFTKTQPINPEIDGALKKAPSKKGGKGSNFPDIKCLIELSPSRRIPVLIEVKGSRGDFIKLDKAGNIDNKTKEGKPNYNSISKFAVNGALHYAESVLKYSTYEEAIAIGINGYYELGSSMPTIEIGTYYLSKDNFYIPKLIDKYTDLSFLNPSYFHILQSKLDELNLTDQEIEEKARSFEDQIESQLKQLNQLMQDDLKISEGSRVELVAGMIMAGLGVGGLVEPLDPSDLKGDRSARNNDGEIIIRKIEDFLQEKNLPEEKKAMIINDLKRVFVYSRLSDTDNGESKLKTIYTFVKSKIMPIFTSARHLDFTGKLFNILNDWVDIPDSSKNDVVLTPRYITDFMARLAQVDMNSYVWDFAVGTAGFLVSSMKLMIKDATDQISSPDALKDKIARIKYQQLLGVEMRSDIYLLAVLNMILMGDGSSNIVHKDSIKEYNGQYEQGALRGQDFPANVFLLNPPYSAPGKGLVFVKKALSKMQSGRAVILIQENAGTRAGLPYTKDILKTNTLLASIHMADIFKGKAGVQTAIYVFNVGVKHNPKSIVKFIDFSNDGYTRQNRKKATIRTNLKDTDRAAERYEEVTNLVLYGKNYLNIFEDNVDYIEDSISLEGDDWTFQQHVKFDRTPSVEDILSNLVEYTSWQYSTLHSSNLALLFQNLPIPSISNTSISEMELNDVEKDTLYRFVNKTYNKRSIEAGKLFFVISNPQLNKDSFVFSPDYKDNLYPYFTRTIENNGIAGYVNYLDDEHKITGNSLAVGMLQMKFFYMSKDFYAGQFTKSLFPRTDKFYAMQDGSAFNENIALYFSCWFNRSSYVYKAAPVRDFNILFNKTIIEVPVTADGLVDSLLINSFMTAAKKVLKSSMKRHWQSLIDSI